MPTQSLQVETMEDAVDHLASTICKRLKDRPAPKRIVVGIAGIPGSGKTTLARHVCEKLEAILNPPGRMYTKPKYPMACVVPMDGFHFSRQHLKSLPNSEEAFKRRGAEWTFDVRKLLRFVEDLRQLNRGCYDSRITLSAPSFDHAKKDPVEDDILVDSRTRVVIVEGLYLCLNKPLWESIAKKFDRLYFLDCPREKAVERLIARHLATGVETTAEAAEARARGSDYENGNLILDNQVDLIHEIIESKEDYLWAGLGDGTLDQQMFLPDENEEYERQLDEQRQKLKERQERQDARAARQREAGRQGNDIVISESPSPALASAPAPAAVQASPSISSNGSPQFGERRPQQASWSPQAGPPNGLPQLGEFRPQQTSLSPRQGPSNSNAFSQLGEYRPQQATPSPRSGPSNSNGFPQLGAFRPQQTSRSPQTGPPNGSPQFDEYRPQQASPSLRSGPSNSNGFPQFGEYHPQQHSPPSPQEVVPMENTAPRLSISSAGSSNSASNYASGHPAIGLYAPANAYSYPRYHRTPDQQRDQTPSSVYATPRQSIEGSDTATLTPTPTMRAGALQMPMAVMYDGANEGEEEGRAGKRKRME